MYLEQWLVSILYAYNEFGGLLSQLALSCSSEMTVFLDLTPLLPINMDVLSLYVILLSGRKLVLHVILACGAKIGFLIFPLPRKWPLSHSAFLACKEQFWYSRNFIVTEECCVLTSHFALNLKLAAASLHTFRWSWMGPATRFSLSCVNQSTTYIRSGPSLSPILSTIFWGGHH
jgi:hypothetical protein